MDAQYLLNRCIETIKNLAIDGRGGRQILDLVADDIRLVIESLDPSKRTAIPGINIVKSEVDLLSADRFIEAIKQIRIRTGMPLKDCKEMAEAAGGRMGIWSLVGGWRRNLA